MLKKILIYLFLGVLILLSQSFASATGGIIAHVSPERIEIGAFFNGSKLFISGHAPEQGEVALRLSGMRSEVALKKKGKILGVLWMNLGSATIKNVPGLYLLCLSKNLQELADKDPEQWENLDIGFHSLRKEIAIESDSNDSDSIFREFVKLKKSEGLYAVEQTTVEYGETKDGQKIYKAVIELPSRLTAGKYLLEVFAVKNGRVVAKTAKELEVEEVGFPAFLSTLAYNHGALYGLLATIVAIAAGLFMGIVFKGGKGAH